MHPLPESPRTGSPRPRSVVLRETSTHPAPGSATPRTHRASAPLPRRTKSTSTGSEESTSASASAPGPAASHSPQAAESGSPTPGDECGVPSPSPSRTARDSPQSGEPAAAPRQRDQERYRGDKHPPPRTVGNRAANQEPQPRKLQKHQQQH